MSPPARYRRPGAFCQPPENPLTSDNKGSQQSLPGGTARRCCPRHAGQSAQSGSFPLPKTAAEWRGGSPSQLALPASYPARISVSSSLLQWLRWARNPPFLNSPDLSHGADAGQPRGSGSLYLCGREPNVKVELSIHFIESPLQTMVALAGNRISPHECASEVKNGPWLERGDPLGSQRCKRHDHRDYPPG